MRSVLAFLILAAAGTLPAAAAERPPSLIRIATFNCSLNRASLGALQRDLSTPDNAQARAVAPVVSTSSTSTTALSLTQGRSRTANAPATFRRRCAALRPVCGGVSLRRTSARVCSENPARLASAAATSSD